jgi:hypothetical protein
MTWIRSPCQVRRTHLSLAKGRFNPPTYGGKTIRLQKPLGIEGVNKVIDIFREDKLAAKLSCKGMLDVCHVIPAIEMADNKKCLGGQEQVLLDEPFRITQANKMPSFLLNRKCIKSSESW